MNHIENILEQWGRERPYLDVASMGLTGRFKKIGKHLQREMEAVFARHGLNLASFDVLATLRRSAPPHQLSPGELLPGDANSKWAQSVPSGQGELGDQNFLTAGHHVGVNTVGQTLRNANRQLRSEPPNPQVKVSPWLQTTIETDANRRPLEIGGCA